MNRIDYYYITVPVPDGITLDIETIMERVEYFNNRRKMLIFDSLTEDGQLNFIFVNQKDSDDDNLIDDIAEFSGLFEGPARLSCFDPEKLTLEQLRHLRLAKRMVGTSTSHYGNGTPRWNTKTRTELLASLDGMVGYAEFKSFMKSLDTYIQNTRTSSRKGCYGVVLINNCKADEDLFINYIYDLYATYDVIIDNVILSGDLDDALCSDRRTPCMFRINERWNLETGGTSFHATSYEQAFRRLSKRETIFITTMDKEEYRRAMMVSSFKGLFTHHVEISEPTSDEKLAILQAEAHEYGFELDTAAFAAAAIMSVPVQDLCSQMAIVVSKKLSEQGACNAVLSPADFGDHTQRNKNSALEELSALVGLDSVKSYINQIVTFLKRRGADAVPCLHMVFRGNPGTGKTTVARLVGRVMNEIGLLPRGDLFVETDREGLVGMYVGHTAVKTSEKIKDAMGGVLFIDEAYSLASDDSFGQEAIATLVKRMEDHRKDFICIMAGYTEEMSKLLDVNPGLRERVQFYIDFPDYNAAELLQIFHQLCSESNYTIDHAGDQALKEQFDLMVLYKGKNFANARLARKVFERIKLKQALRSEGNEITAEDVVAVFADADIMPECKAEKRKIGFGLY